MGALGSLFGLGQAHQVQSPRGSAGFSDFGSDPGDLMRNSVGTSQPGGGVGSWDPMGGFSGGLPPGMGGMQQGMGGGMGGNPLAMLMGGGGMGGGMQGGLQQRVQQQQQNPYGIVPPRGMQGGYGQQQGGQQAGGMGDPLGIMQMLGGL